MNIVSYSKHGKNWSEESRNYVQCVERDQKQKYMTKSIGKETLTEVHTFSDYLLKYVNKLMLCIATVTRNRRQLFSIYFVFGNLSQDKEE